VPFFYGIISFYVVISTCNANVYSVVAAVRQLNRQLAQDVQHLDREIERNSLRHQPARHRYATPANRPRWLTGTSSSSYLQTLLFSVSRN